MRNAPMRLLRPFAAAIALTVSLPAFATAQRAFVASHGVDNAACSLGSPCRAFAAALTAVSPGGEIVVLDSGGYGRVTITKSVTLVAPAGVHAGISVFAGTNGIDIPAGGIKVVLRGLAVTGQGGVHGIYVTGNNELAIERCDIGGMGTNGIHLDNVSGTLQVRDTVVHDNGGFGVMLFGALSASLQRVSIERNTLSGIGIYDGGSISVKDSTLVRNNRGVEMATLTIGITTRFFGDGLQISSNNHQGILATNSVGRNFVRLARSIVEYNPDQGVSILMTGPAGAGYAIGSLSDNVFATNGTAIKVTGNVSGILIARNVFAEENTVDAAGHLGFMRSTGDNQVEPETGTPVVPFSAGAKF